MIEPFRIATPGGVLEDLTARLRATRLPRHDDEDDGRGISPAYLRELISYWGDGFEWRIQEALLNRFQHFRVEVDGTRIHLIREKGRGPSPLPLILTHGYPDSFYRFHKLISLLSDPEAHGADAADAFDVIVPGLPGYAYSEPRDQNGGLFGFGDLWHKLMTEELGYNAFGAHGGDWGSTVTEHLARSHSGSLIGIHLTDVPFWHMFEKPKDLTSSERTYLDKNERWQKESGAYAMIQGTRPRTAAVGLNDSPAGLAAWIVEKFHEWSDCGDHIESRYSKDELLTNVMIYWTTQTIESSFQPYRDVMDASGARWVTEAAKRWIGSSKTPAGFAIFPRDISTPPRE
jgi:microsomal epoxide hydrolase